VRGNPPSALAPTTLAPLAAEAQQFFLTGEPGLADRYFPWLVNLMSPAYWVYLVMAVTILFNGMNLYSRFRLWRIDAAREKLEAALGKLVGPSLTHAQIRAGSPNIAPVAEPRRSDAEDILNGLEALRARCQRQVKSFVTPM